MQGLSEAPASMFGENGKFDDVEVAADPLGGGPLRKRVTQQIRPVLAALTDVPPAVTADLIFSPTGELVDFLSHDRSRATTDGRSVTRLTWNTPIAKYLDLGRPHARVCS